MAQPKLIYYVFVFMLKIVIYDATQVLNPKDNVFMEERTSVMVKSILKEIKGVSEVNCALRCRILKECIRSATEERKSGTVCLLLKGHSNNDGDMEKNVISPMRVLTNFKPGMGKVYKTNKNYFSVQRHIDSK